MKIKKVVLLLLLFTLFGTILGGCTPKERELWVLYGEVKFSIKAQVFDVVYNGTVREFGVKNKESFERSLREMAQFKGLCSLADTGKDAFVFENDGKQFIIYNKEKNRYVLRRSQSVIYKDNQGIWFDCIPLEGFENIENGVEVCCGWDNIKEYFQTNTSAEINENNKKINIKAEDKLVVLTLEGNKLKAKC